MPILVVGYGLHYLDIWIPLSYKHSQRTTHLDANVVCWVLWVVQRWELFHIQRQSQHHFCCHSDEVCADRLGHKGAGAGGTEIELYHLKTVYKALFSTNATDISLWLSAEQFFICMHFSVCFGSTLHSSFLCLNIACIEDKCFHAYTNINASMWYYRNTGLYML